MMKLIHKEIGFHSQQFLHSYYLEADFMRCLSDSDMRFISFRYPRFYKAWEFSSCNHNAMLLPPDIA